MTKKRKDRQYHLETGFDGGSYLNKETGSEFLSEDCFKCVSKCLQNDEIRFFILLKLLGDVKKVMEKNGVK